MMRTPVLVDEDQVLDAVLRAFRKIGPCLADLHAWTVARQYYPMSKTVFYLATGMLSGQQRLVPVDRHQPVNGLIDYVWQVAL